MNFPTKHMTSAVALFLLIMSFAPTLLNAYELYEIDELLYSQQEKVISMDFKDAALGDVLKIFSQQSGMNFIASDNISTKIINLYLDRVPVEEALERILSANSLTYELKPESNVFVVKELARVPIELTTKIYPLKYATVSNSPFNSTLSSSEDETTSSSTTTEQATSIKDAVAAVLTSNGSVVQDPRTNSLIVTDIPGIFPRVEQVVSRLDVRIPQIMIEVEMLDITKNTAEQLGAKFKQENGSPAQVKFFGPTKSILWPFNTDNAFDDALGSDVGGNRALSSGGEEEPIYTVGQVSFQGLAFTLEFLRSQTDTRNLARPHILTLNNHTATIEISNDEAIATKATSVSVGSTGGASSSEEAERAETGVFLKVTPQANMLTHEITLAIEPKVIEAKPSSGFTGADAFKDVETRGTKSILRVTDGDTIIIGGLLRNDTTDIRNKVPMLGDIPFLGAAFRHKDNSVDQRELIVFLTPHILENVVSQYASTQAEEHFIREQRAPSERSNKIDKEMSTIERQMSK